MVAELLAEKTQLLERLSHVEAENSALQAKYTSLESWNTKLKRENNWLRNQLFGSKTERHEVIQEIIDPKQHSLLEEELSAEACRQIEEELRGEDDESDATLPGDTASPKSKKGSQNGRGRLPDGIEVERIVLDIPEEDKICPHGHSRQCIGEDVTEELEIIPARFIKREIVRPKWACPSCPHRECGGIHTALLPPRPIEKGRPGPGLLSSVAVSKYGDHLPLYRQEKIFERLGVNLSRKTLCDWILALGELLGPIVLAMKRKLLKGGNLQADETPIRVQRVKKGSSKQGYLWGYGVPWGEVVYDFTLGRTQDHPVRFLAGYTGYLQVDGYAGYNAVFATREIVHLGCFAHARRKFKEALPDAPEAKTPLAAIQLLYRLEREMKELGLGPEERATRRQREALPILEKLHLLLENYRLTALPSSSLGKAVRYALSEWPHLVRYVEVGKAEIDNNSIEQTLRPVAVGRKNYLFAGSPRGGEAAAVLYSLITSCKRLGVDPEAYMKDVIGKISTHPMRLIEELTPSEWKAAREAAVVEAAPVA